MTYPYYSNWNKNRRPGLGNVLRSLWQLPKNLFSKVREQKGLVRKLLLIGVYLGAALLLVGSLVFAAVSLSLPDPNKLNNRIVAQSTKIYARDGTTLLY